MKEALIHRNTISKAKSELIGKCEVITLKNETSNPDIADRATRMMKITVKNLLNSNTRIEKYSIFPTMRGQV